MNVLKLFLGAISLRFAVDSDMFFNQEKTNLFSLQFFVETGLLVIGFYLIAKFYSNDRTNNN